MDDNNIAMILKEKGDLDLALTFSQRALTIAEKVYGPDSAQVALCANNIGFILRDKKDFERALGYTKQALKIDENAYGPNHPSVGRDANNIGAILKDKGDLDGALTYSQRALDIFTKSYGPENPQTKNGGSQRRTNKTGEISPEAMMAGGHPYSSTQNPMMSRSFFSVGPDKILSANFHIDENFIWPAGIKHRCVLNGSQLLTANAHTKEVFGNLRTFACVVPDARVYRARKGGHRERASNGL